MKSLKTLNNKEKARLLHVLLPEEIPGLLKFAEDVAAVLKNHPDLFRQTWRNNSFSVELWFDLAEKATTNIKNHSAQLKQSSFLFAEQLFNGLSAVFMIHCLRNYVVAHKYSDSKFKDAVNLLFNSSTL